MNVDSVGDWWHHVIYVTEMKSSGTGFFCSGGLGEITILTVYRIIKLRVILKGKNYCHCRAASFFCMEKRRRIPYNLNTCSKLQINWNYFWVNWELLWTVAMDLLKITFSVIFVNEQFIFRATYRMFK